MPRSGRALLLPGVLVGCGVAMSAVAIAHAAGEPLAGSSVTAAELIQLPGQEFLEQAGIPVADLTDMDHQSTWDGPQFETALRILQRLVQTPVTLRESLTTKEVSAAALFEQPPRYRGAFVELKGRVVAVIERHLDAELFALTQFESFYECELMLSDGLRASVCCREVPLRWLSVSDLDESAAVRGVFVGRSPSVANTPSRLWLIAARVAWLPDAKGLVPSTPGEQMLGMLRCDVGLFDAIKHRTPLRPEEHDAFYGLLRAVQDVRRERLADLATRRLPAFLVAVEDRAAQVRQQRATIEAQLAAGELRGDRGTAAVAQLDRYRQHEALVREVRRRGEQNAYSVAPLFLDAGHYTGQLVLLEGIARRAIRIEIATPGRAAGKFSPIGHYYELDVFTPDSQRLPIVCCVHDLPTGFPVGDVIAEQVRIAGFFFKQWRFTSRRLETRTEPGVTDRIPEAVPLVIGRGPIWVRPAGIGQNPWLEVSLGGSFVVIVAAVAWYLNRMHRRDREFRRRRLDNFYRM